MARSLGLDFGTTNTVLAQADASGQTAPIAFEFQGASLSALRTALCFWSSSAGTALEAGPWAIQHFIDDPGDRRFIQSLKTFAANPSFKGTTIYGKAYLFEDLLAAYMGKLLGHAGSRLAALPKRLVVGRPVHYAGAAPDAGLATATLRDGAASLRLRGDPLRLRAGGGRLLLCARLKTDATVLVADFGGGTTDYSVMHFGVANGRYTPSR